MEEILPLLIRNGYEQKVDQLFRNKISNLQCSYFEHANSFLKTFSDTSVGQVTYFLVANLLKSLKMNHTLLTFTVETGYKLDGSVLSCIKGDLLKIRKVKRDKGETMLDGMMRWYMKTVEKDCLMKAKKETYLTKLNQMLGIDIILKNIELENQKQIEASGIQMPAIDGTAEDTQSKMNSEGRLSDLASRASSSASKILNFFGFASEDPESKSCESLAGSSCPTRRCSSGTKSSRRNSWHGSK